MNNLGANQFEHLTRQMDIIDIKKLHTPITVIGCGAIGSFAVLALAKMGMSRITHWDFDHVSIENMNNQFFRFSDIDSNKSTALQSLVYDFTGTRTTAHANAFERDNASDLSGIVVVAVDSMKVRKQVFEAIKESGFNVQLLIDPRMSAEFFAQYAVNPFDEKDSSMYQKTLYSDSEAVAERCTAKSTIYTATLAAGIVAKTVKNFIMREQYPRNTQWDIKASQQGMQMWASV